MRSAVISVISIMAVVLLVDFFSKSPKSLLSGLMLNMEVLNYANLISVMYYPSGMYGTTVGNYFFLGHRNQFIIYVLLTIVVALLYMQTVKKGLRPVLLIIMSCLSIVRAWSATSICGLIVFGGILLLGKTNFNSWVTYPKVFITTLTIDLLISVFRVLDRVLWVSWFIESFLRRNLTLTGRTALWDIFYVRFAASPWIGYGVGATIRGTLSAHNQWFQFLLEGGIVGLILFLLFTLISVKHMVKYKESTFVFAFYGSFAALYIGFIADVYSYAPWIYILYILAYHIDKFETMPGAAANSLRPKSGAVQYTKKMRGYEKDERNNYPAGTASNS